MVSSDWLTLSSGKFTVSSEGLTVSSGGLTVVVFTKGVSAIRLGKNDRLKL
jgi:hypothetical protein